MTGRKIEDWREDEVVGGWWVDGGGGELDLN